MSSFHACLYLTSPSGAVSKYPLSHCSVRSNRRTGPKGEPIHAVNAGKIFMVFRDPVDEMIRYWAFNPTTFKNGVITFYDGTTDIVKHNEVEFKRGFAIDYEQNFTAENPSGSMVFSLAISCEKLIDALVEHDNKWGM